MTMEVETYGQQLRNVRQAAGASLEEVATEMGSNKWRLHQVETGKDDPADPDAFRRDFLDALDRITQRRRLAVTNAVASVN